MLDTALELDTFIRGKSGLALVVGPPCSGKTRLLNLVAARSGVERTNLSLLLASHLKGFPARDQGIAAASFGDQITAGVLDDLEVLFTRHLALDPVRWLELLAKRGPVVAAWPGGLEGDQLLYGPPGHPERFEQSVPACLIVRMA